MFAERTNWNLNRNRLSQTLQRHRDEGKSLIDLTLSNPTECGFELDGAAILQALCQPSALRYEPNARGMESARRAVAAYYRARHEEIAPQDIILTTSTSEAYSFLFRTLCNPADEILVPEPSYPLFTFLADIHDVSIARYPLLYDQGWQIDFHALEKIITSRTRGLIVVHPNNPTGHFCKPAEVERLNQICSAWGLAIIADEVFFDFIINDNLLPSFVSNSGALTFTMSGLSKISGLPQMKTAWLITSGPEQLKSQALERLEVIADTFLSMNTPVQQATPVFLEQRHRFQEQLRARVLRNLAELDRQLAVQTVCKRLAVEGGWYVVIRVPALRSDEDLAIELLTTRDVYAHPGHFYDFPTEGYLVMSLITAEREFSEGMQRVLSVF
ncbi:MAG TPA: pyridoxal phosphate-dependent aminotransferase [Candidatus Dormibacteraeota bacterium]|nr:pyridoxal phosphate-dependent aminotransferase [Candidatus Dormibacteraeota bacterium]